MSEPIHSKHSEQMQNIPTPEQAENVKKSKIAPLGDSLQKSSLIAGQETYSSEVIHPTLPQSKSNSHAVDDWVEEEVSGFTTLDYLMRMGEIGAAIRLLEFIMTEFEAKARDNQREFSSLLNEMDTDEMEEYIKTMIDIMAEWGILDEDMVDADIIGTVPKELYLEFMGKELHEEEVEDLIKMKELAQNLVKLLQNLEGDKVPEDVLKNIMLLIKQILQVQNDTTQFEPKVQKTMDKLVESMGPYLVPVWMEGGGNVFEKANKDMIESMAILLKHTAEMKHLELPSNVSA